MVIDIPADTVEKAKSTGGSSMAAVLDLLLAFARGHHIIHIQPDIARKLASHPALGPREKASIALLLRRHHEIASLRLVVSAKIVATVDGGVTLTHVNDQAVIAVPIEQFNSHYWTGPARFVCENLTDAKLLIVVARALAPLGRIAISVDQIPGGGSTVGTVLASLEGPVLCVVDSDRRHPAESIGDTAQAAVDAAGPSKVVYVTRVRELENAFSIETIREALYETAHPVEKLHLQQHHSIGDNLWSAHSDRKTAVLTKDITSDAALHKFWLNAPSWPGRPACLDDGCNCNHVCHAMFGLTSGLLGVLENFLLRIPATEGAGHARRGGPDLESIAKLLSSFGAAYPRQVT